MKISKRNKIIFSIVLLLIVIVLVASYAIWQLTRKQTNENEIATGCFNITYTEKSAAINLSETYPLTDEEGLKGSPYKFTIKNICEKYVAYQINLEILPVPGGRISSQYMKAGLNDKVYILNSDNEVDPTIETAIESYNLFEEGLKKDEEITFDLRLWIAEGTPASEGENKSFKSKINIIAVAAKEINTLKKQILANNVLKQETPIFNLTPTAATSGLYTTVDHYGTTYYFRGERDSLANNVIFAERQWKIIRINGDGTARLIYNGTCPGNTCTINSTGTQTAINGTTYQWISNYNDAKYVGYMFGGARGETTSTKEQAQANETNTDTKATLDKWYEDNIKGTQYEQYIADNIFCNDRSITSGNGYGSGLTHYKVYTRLYTNASNPIPTLLCEQQNDRFTVNDVTKGNGALTYPVGLITADEAQFGGIGYSFYNTNQYLNSGIVYWAYSPAYFSPYAYVWYVSSNGQLTTQYVDGSHYLRPVINLSLKADTTGEGTTTNPYVVSK